MKANKLKDYMFVPNTTSVNGTHIHDAIDCKRIMCVTFMALLPILCYGMYRVGFFNVLSRLLVTYIIGYAIEIVSAHWRGKDVQEGFLVTGMIIVLISPVSCPLWILVLSTAFAVIFAQEVFGGIGMNVFNVALVARAFMFLSYPTKMGGLYIGNEGLVFIFVGALILLWTQVASWKTILSVFVGGILTALLLKCISVDNAFTSLPWYEHLLSGGFCFGAIFIATDPVTSARTEWGKFISGFIIGSLAILISFFNPVLSDGILFSILFMNIFTPLIDYFVVQRNISRRMKRVNRLNS